MELPQRGKLPHEAPHWVAEGSWFFITISCVPRGVNQRCQEQNGRRILEALAFYHEKMKWHCRIALMMPDHLHAILTFPSHPGMKTTIANWKRYLARETGIQWQRDFFDHRLRNDQEEKEKTSYILNNPVRKGLCAVTEDWPWIYRPNNRLPPKLG